MKLAVYENAVLEKHVDKNWLYSAVWIQVYIMSGSKFLISTTHASRQYELNSGFYNNCNDAFM